MTEGLNIEAELNACGRSLAILERLLAEATSAGQLKKYTLETQHQQWTRYRAGLIIVRDDRPVEPTI